MIRTYVPLLAFVALCACDGDPFGAGGAPVPPGPVPQPDIPASISQNLFAAAFDPVSNTLAVDLRSLDGTPVNATYTRNAALDVPGFDAYVAQESSTQRYFLAMFRRAPSGAAEAVTVADGGQFANYFAGGTYRQIGDFNMPASGLATYTGAYVGLLNTGITIPGTGGATFDPQRSERVTGEMLLNADFNPNNLSVNGAIRNRTGVDLGGVYDDVFLWVTDVDANGRFSGTVRLDPQTTVGDYGGQFGGVDASDVAGAAAFSPVRGNSQLREHGAFVLPVCTAGAPAPCP